MHIFAINNRQNKSFTSKNSSRQATLFYKKLDGQFLKVAQVQGINKGTMLELIKRLQLSPSFEKLPFEEACRELFQKIVRVVEYVNTGKSERELRKELFLSVEAAERLVKTREHKKFLEVIVNAYNSGEQVSEIASRYKLSGETIRKYLKSCGIQFDKPRGRYDDEIVRRVLAGETDIDIVDATGACFTTIRAVRKKFGLAPNHKLGRVQMVQDEILEKLQQGVKREVIADELHLCKNSVDKIAGDNNVFQNKVTQRNKEILEKLEQGVSTKDLAKEYGVCHSTILRVAWKNGFDVKKNSEKRRLAVIEALKTKGPTQVAKEFNLSIQTIYNIKYEYSKSLS